MGLVESSGCTGELWGGCAEAVYFFKPLSDGFFTCSDCRPVSMLCQGPGMVSIVSDQILPTYSSISLLIRFC